MARIAVIGGGILGTVSALLARERGHDVSIFERESALWTGASAANEGKIHLGPIFALGDRATHLLMLTGATTFASIVEQAVGHPIDWDAMASADFEYLVMPGSLASPGELSARYAQMNAMLAELPSRSYLGNPLTSIIDEKPGRDTATGLPAFSSRERSVEPIALRDIVVDALHGESVEMRLGAHVTKVEQSDGVATLQFRDGTVSEPFDAVINATWHDQGTLVPATDWHALNYRVKLAVRVPNDSFARAITLVHGPFGDLVALPECTYLSWYPVGRLAHGSGLLAPAHVTAAHASLFEQHSIAREILDSLRATNLWSGDPVEYQIIGGVIMGHGAVDIDARDSELHARSEFHVLTTGRLFTPVNFKFTTAPLAALRAVERLHTVTR